MVIRLELDTYHPRSDGTCRLRICCAKGGKLYRYPLPVLLLPKHWNGTLSPRTPDYLRTSKIIEGEYQRALDLHAEDPTVTAKELCERLKTGAKASGESLWDLVASWEREAKTKGTASQYRHTLRRLKEHGDLDLRSASDKDFEDLLKELSKGRRPNTAWNYQKVLNKAIRYSNKRMGRKMETLALVRLETAKDEVVLTWEDLRKIMDFEPASKAEGKVMCAVVGMALTGIRIGDLLSLCGTVDIRDGILCSRFHCSKPPHLEVSPIIFKPFSELMEQYGLPIYMDRKYLRIAVRTLTDKICGKKVKLHSLRRSFITNFLSLGVIPEHLLARVFTGHSLGSGEAKVFHGYNHATLGTAQKTILRLLDLVPPEQTGGVELL